MTPMNFTKFRKSLMFLTLTLLVSCTSASPNISSDKKIAEAMTKKFLAGEILLTCGISCSGSWGLIKAKQRKFYNMELWAELAELTLKNGHEVDINYYYLGRSAEGLGFTEAAKVCYKNALMVVECAGRINNCDGFDVPELVTKRFKNL